MFTRKRLIFLWVTAWMITDVNVEAYMSGCSGGYCFVISDYTNNNERVYQSSAQQRCLSNGTQLVEIRNKDIQNSLISFITNVYTSSIGLNGWNVFTNGKRSSGGDWIRLTGISTVGLRLGGQTDVSYAYGYLKSTTSGFDLFASRPADIKRSFICTGFTDCSGGVPISGQCYKSFPDTLSWYDARNRCLDAGGDLASFDQITTNAGFNALNGSWMDASKSYWVGFRRESWRWQNTNSDVKYSEWLDGHPLNYVSSDCLCLSTTTWKWIECVCDQQLPFVCISDNNSAASSSSTTTTKTSAVTTTKWTSNLASAIDRVETPTIPVAATSKSTQDGNDTGSMDQSMEHNKQAVVGIGVGVGVGGALIVIALVAVVIILCRKRCPLRCPERKKTNAKPQPPDILMKDGNEDPYAQVVSSSPELNNTDATIVYTNDNQTHTVYAPIRFCTEPQVQHDGNVTIVAGKTQPSAVSIPPKNNAATNHFKVGGDLYAEVTKA